MATTPKKLGRSLLAGETTVDEIRTLTKRFTAAKHYVRDELTTYAYDSIVVDGDLAIDGDLDTYKHGFCRLVVTGDLTVGGCYGDYDDPETAVFVLGDFEANNAITNGALFVAGNVTVHEALVGYYNDHSAHILGSVTATVFSPENHGFAIGGKLVADYILGANAKYRLPAKLWKSIRPVEGAALRALLVPEVLEGLDGDEDDDIYVNDRELMKRVTNGQPILANAARSTKRAMPAKPAAKKTKVTKPKRAAKTTKRAASAKRKSTKTPKRTTSGTRTQPKRAK